MRGSMKLFVFILTMNVHYSLTLKAFESLDLKIAIVQEWSSFNPVTSQLASTEALMPFVLRKMTSRLANGSVVAEVAESVPELKNKIAIWTIKSNARWSDGTLITCADWHLGWQVGLNENVSVSAKSTHNKIKVITWLASKPQDCKVVYEADDWSYDRDLPPLLPAHIEQSIFQTNKTKAEAYDQQSRYVTQPTQLGLYNGPYQITEFKTGSHIIFEINPYFYGIKPQIKKISVRLISDAATLKSNLLAGEINMISAVGFPPDTAISLSEDSAKKDAKFNVFFQNSSIFQGLYFNLEKELFKDEKVRKALSLAINKNQIVEAFFKNKMKVAEGILPPQHKMHTDRKTLFSKAEAEKLLSESGWKKNTKGILEKNGKSFTVIYKTSAGLKVLENIQGAICSNWKSIGVDCLIKNEPPRVLLGTSVPKGDFDISMFGQPIPPDSTISSYFSSKEIPNSKNSWAGGNVIRLKDKDADQLLTEFDKEKSPKKRNVLIKKLDQLFYDKTFLIPLYHRREAIVYPKNLKGLSDSFEGTAFRNPEEWKF